MERGLTRKDARDQVEKGNGMRWRVEELPGRGSPQALYPLENHAGGVNPAAEKAAPDKDFSAHVSAAVEKNRVGANGGSGKPLGDKGFREGPISAAAPLEPPLPDGADPRCRHVADRGVVDHVPEAGTFAGPVKKVRV